MILYFSATGNTRFIAQELARRLNDEALDLTARIREGNHSPIESQKPFVICSPVYVCEPPRFLLSFLRKTPLCGNGDVYFVFTSGGYSGISAVLCRQLARSKGLRYRGSADFKMPRNYLISTAYPPLEKAEIEARIRASWEKLPAAVEAIQAGRKISFLYGKRRLDDETHAVSVEEKRFVVSPYALVWSNDHYYLVCNNAKYNNLMHTRIDRMKKVELTAVISSASLKKLQNHEPVSLNVLMKISEALDVPIEKIVEFRRI